MAVALLAGCGDADDGIRNYAPPDRNPERAGGENGMEVGDGTGGVVLTEIGTFDEPVYLTGGRKGRLWVVERTGAIRVVDNGEVREEPFLDISDKITAEGQEQGLLSMAFSPDYAESGLFYVSYTDTEGDSRVVEYRHSEENPLVADPGSAREVLSVDQPFDNHNGGLILFGPDDLMYIGFGDGGDAGDPDRNGQNLATPLGKLLRIDPAQNGDDPYSIPDDNPFLGQAGTLEELYSYGLRNPWRFSFDRETGALSIGDVGQDEQEEIDYVEAGDGAGANFGWSAFEGTSPFNSDQEAEDHIPPVLTYGREEGCSVTGGYVVRDTELESLYGRYLYADFCLGRLRSFIPSPDGATDDRELDIEIPAVSSFAEDGAGNIYVLSLEGPVFRLDPEE